MNSAFLRRVVLKNYRSVGVCDVPLGPITFLVGPNGSGKSNFLDALRLTAEGLRTSLEHALRDRGGIAEVRRRSGGHPTHFGIRLEMTLPSGADASYAFQVGAAKGGGFVLHKEECRVGQALYLVVDGQLAKTSETVMPAVATDRLYLVAAGGLPAFRPAYDALSRMSFLNPVPDVIRTPQPPDPGEQLARDGRNLASVVDRMPDAARARVREYLAQIVPGIRGVEVVRALGLETLEFRQDVPGQKEPWRFKAGSMSDGTLRAFCVLVALFQGAVGTPRSPLVCLEEPEMALHPAAAGVLLDALEEAAGWRQVLVTTHSPDLLESSSVGAEMIRAVVLEAGETHVGPVDDAGREALARGLYSAGELLRLAQLAPDPTAAAPRQLGLFEAEE
jgi:predicted ATPase